MYIKERCLTKTLSVVNDNFTIDVKDFNTGIFTFAGTFTGLGAVFEYSNNSTNGTDGLFYTLAGVGTDNVGTAYNSFTGASSPVTRGYCFSLAGLRFIRIRLTAITTGAVDVTFSCTEASGLNVLATTTNNMQGLAAHDAAVSGNPVRVGARAVTSLYASVASGDVADLISTTTGALAVVQNTVPEAKFQFTTVLTTNADVAIQAAAGTGIRNYLTGIQYQNTNATGTGILIKDGSTVIAQFSAPANMAAPAVISFDSPIRTTANTALNVQCGTTGANVMFNAQGFRTP